MNKTNFKDLYNPADFAQQGLLVFELLLDFLQNAQSEGSKTINYRSPEEELDFWKNWSNKHKEAAENQKVQALISSLFEHTNHIHNPKYIGHQVGAPLPINSFYLKNFSRAPAALRITFGVTILYTPSLSIPTFLSLNTYSTVL